MKLKHIQYETCPICDSPVVMQRIGFKHINGEQHEIVSFECEHSLEYSPNFSRTKIRNECPNNPEVIIKMEKRKKSFEKLQKYIEKMDCDKEFKEKILEEISWINL